MRKCSTRLFVFSVARYTVNDSADFCKDLEFPISECKEEKNLCTERTWNFTWNMEITQCGVTMPQYYYSTFNFRRTVVYISCVCPLWESQMSCNKNLSHCCRMVITRLSSIVNLFKLNHFLFCLKCVSVIVVPLKWLTYVDNNANL